MKKLTAGIAASTPNTSASIVSFFRQNARQCEIAARIAPNKKVRAELSKMVHVWRAFADEHERMTREGNIITVFRNHRLKGWM